MDFINFKVGSKTISLKILDILVTERFENDLTELPNKNKSFIGIKDYMGTPTPVFDLGIILNGESTYSINSALAELLQAREKDHIEWVKALEDTLHNGTSFEKTRDPHKCAFGQWYDKFKTDDEDLKIILDKFAAPHTRIHELADELINMSQQGHKEQALDIFEHEKRTTYTLLLRLFESAKEQVILDYKPIIIFTTTDGVHPHIGLLVDKVGQSVNVNKEDIKPLEKLTSIGFDIDPQTRNMMRGLIKMEKIHSVIIDPSVIFLEEQADKELEAETI
ncbi:CZB domain-containing protein [Pseudoalteromonas denitrificans]|uniref:Chemoreceptor zinc-binding domain-containing protein n=1 Tax=Pseudoalteromonas denitrificans DSM 6059 TaxID=1123010 RepID=A0A1I1SKS0_9GAMM|nr:CZB domain-containing protein [Pseudoalteromonas denitrificans]SFD45268.1 Chemoreceptor zinc-binding domain-containing protein [Pseudoalteromonas denitrificans DSM 6059]